MGTKSLPDFHSAIFGVRDFIFWLNAVHPYEVQGFKSRGPAEKFIIDLRTAYHPMTKKSKILIFQCWSDMSGSLLDGSG